MRNGTPKVCSIKRTLLLLRRKRREINFRWKHWNCHPSWGFTHENVHQGSSSKSLEERNLSHGVSQTAATQGSLWCLHPTHSGETLFTPGHLVPPFQNADYGPKNQLRFPKTNMKWHSLHSSPNRPLHYVWGLFHCNLTLICSPVYF